MAAGPHQADVVHRVTGGIDLVGFFEDPDRAHGHPDAGLGGHRGQPGQCLGHQILESGDWQKLACALALGHDSRDAKVVIQNLDGIADFDMFPFSEQVID